MSLPILINNKNSLVFAGGVLVAAGLFASMFTPPSLDEKDEEQPAAVEATSGPSDIAAPEAQMPIFGEYQGPDDITEEDLIDDTAGIDPTPDLAPSTSADISAPQTRDESSAKDAPTSGQAEPMAGPRVQRSQVTRESEAIPPARKGLTSKDIRERLASPPRVSKTDN